MNRNILSGVLFYLIGLGWLRWGTDSSRLGSFLRQVCWNPYFPSTRAYAKIVTTSLQKSIFFNFSFAKMSNLVFSFDWRGHMMIFSAISEKLISWWIFWYFMKTRKNLDFVLVISPKVYIGLPCGFQQTRVPFFIFSEMYRT